MSDSFAQNYIEDFLKPSDSLNYQRKKTVILAESAFTIATLIGLNQLWYADYPKSDFHFINDNNEWLQIDKMGHIFSAYHLGNYSKNALQWSGISKKNQIIYGATFGFAFLTAIEVLDGYSQQWGASTGDVTANAAGTCLLISQEIFWKEQRIIPKYSFHTTEFASQRPNILGKSLNEQILKDYNGQTHWLSINLHSFYKKSKIPKWLNVAVGFGAENMISGNTSFSDPNIKSIPERYRQFYLSFDADLTKIKTKSALLKTVFSVFNTIKIPAPTLEYNTNGAFNFRYLYF
jgi:Predicted periplasmic lipoprotein (DUF2279)